jgi:Phospholipase D Active site motif
VGTLFTHHQKCVLVDTQARRNNRKITAFIGGLDLCDGRYDTPQHRLFADLDTVFKNDLHQPTFSVSTSILLDLVGQVTFLCKVNYYNNDDDKVLVPNKLSKLEMKPNHNYFYANYYLKFAKVSEYFNL